MFGQSTLYLLALIFESESIFLYDIELHEVYHTICMYIYSMYHQHSLHRHVVSFYEYRRYTKFFFFFFDIRNCTYISGSADDQSTQDLQRPILLFGLWSYIIPNKHD